MADQQVTSPDQRKPINRRWARIFGIIAIPSLLSMTQPFNNHSGWVADFFLILTAGIIAVLLIGDAVLVRRGLRR